jgi:hypothetical protein
MSSNSSVSGFHHTARHPSILANHDTGVGASNAAPASSSRLGHGALQPERRSAGLPPGAQSARAVASTSASQVNVPRSSQPVPMPPVKPKNHIERYRENTLRYRKALAALPEKIGKPHQNRAIYEIVRDCLGKPNPHFSANDTRYLTLIRVATFFLNEDDSENRQNAIKRFGDLAKKTNQRLISDEDCLGTEIQRQTALNDTLPFWFTEAAATPKLLEY